MAYATSALPDKRSALLLAAQQANHTLGRDAVYFRIAQVWVPDSFPQGWDTQGFPTLPFYTILYQHLYPFAHPLASDW